MNNIKGVYLCARKHRFPGLDIDYNDVLDYPGVDILTSCENINLGAYDFIIATPPCNYYSKANYRRETSDVALKTKHLLPWCINACYNSGKYFIVENVNNEPLFSKMDIPKNINKYKFGGHTFWTNVDLDLSGCVPVKQNKQHVCRNKRDNNYNVDLVLKLFILRVFQIINCENVWNAFVDFVIRVKDICES